jgi:hypothetical protein
MKPLRRVVGVREIQERCHLESIVFLLGSAPRNKNMTFLHHVINCRLSAVPRRPLMLSILLNFSERK